MTDTERIDWLEQHWDFKSDYDYQRGHSLRRSASLEGVGPTFREAVDSLIRQYNRVMHESW